MDRLISLNAVLSAIGEWIAHREYDYTNATEYLRNRIKAIPSAEPCEDANANQHNSNALNDVGQHTNALEGDAISRQALLDAFGFSEKTRKWGGDHSGYNTMMLYEIQDVIESQPLVKPQEPKTDDMTSSHSELDIYKGCIDLMNDLLRQVYEWLEIVGIDVSEMDEDEQFATHFYTTEIVKRLFLWKTSHSGGTSQRMKLKELGITDDAVLFDFAKMIEPQERSDKE